MIGNGQLLAAIRELSRVREDQSAARNRLHVSVFGQQTTNPTGRIACVVAVPLPRPPYRDVRVATGGPH